MNKKLPSLNLFYLICTVALLATLLSNGWFGGWLGKTFNKSVLPYWWNDVLDPVIGIATFIFAVLIWRLEQKEYALQKLEKRLTVHFEHEGKYIMSCFEAYLAGEADIRAWAQSIGQQMNNGKPLLFYPYFTLLPKPVIHNHYVLHEVTVHLKNVPDGNEHLNDNYLAWYGNDNKKNQTKWLAGHPTDKPQLNEIKNAPTIQTPKAK